MGEPASPLRAAREAPAAPPDASRVLALLGEIDELPGSATGALFFGSRESPAGIVLVEHGRVCWAVAAGMRRRMTDMLREEAASPVDAASIEAVYRRCCGDGRPLGEALVAAGIVDEAGLRRTLERHVLEAMAMLTRAPLGEPTWVGHRRQRYDARFTFEPAAILACLGAQVHADLADPARAALALALALGGSGVAFVRGRGTAAAVPVAVEGPLAVRDVVALTRWACDALDVASAFAPQRDLFLASTIEGPAAAAWRDGALSFAALFPEPSGLAAIVVQWARARRQER